MLSGVEASPAAAASSLRDSDDAFLPTRRDLAAWQGLATLGERLLDKLEMTGRRSE
jgi:hypothetical protein